MAKDAKGSAEVGGGLTELIGRALTDEKFRDKLFTQRSQAVAGYKLSKTDMKALENLSREDLQQSAEVFGSAAMPTISIKITIKF
jgi:hypothetical protein